MFEWNSQPASGVETNLYASWPPLYEVGQLALSDALQALVHLCGIHLTLHTTQATSAAVLLPLQLLQQCDSTPMNTTTLHN